MSDASTYREASKAKIKRMLEDPQTPVDASGYTPPGPELGMIQTGERPVTRARFRAGGSVTGGKTAARVDRKPRASGGMTATDFINRDVREANESRAGMKNNGGFKYGGAAKDNGRARAHKFMGGPMQGGANPYMAQGAPMKPGYAKGGKVNPADVARWTNNGPLKAHEMPALHAENAENIKKGYAPYPTVQPHQRPAGSGGRKDGGKVHADAAEDKKLIKSEMAKHEAGCKCAKCYGGRTKRAEGGKTRQISGFPDYSTAKTHNLRRAWEAATVAPKGSVGAKYKGAIANELLDRPSPKLPTGKKPDDPAKWGLANGGRAGKAEGGGIPSTTHKYDESGKMIPPKEYHIYDNHSGSVVGKAATLKGARRAADRRDTAYGGVKHSAVPVYARGGAIPDGTRPKGGRIARAKGGKAMNVNIIIAPPKPAMGMPPPGMAGPPKGIPAPPPAAAPQAGAPAPMAPAGGAAPMMGRKDGGRTYPLKDGSGGGKGRLQKIKAYG